MADGRSPCPPRSILILGQLNQWSGAALASLIISALVSDIFDGILARRWHCDTPAVRLFDSMADTAFYFSTAIALWLRYPNLWSTHILLFGSLLTLEATRFLYDFARFGKPSSYHSYLAKAWGLLLATAVITAFLTPHADILISAALLLGILCDLEGLTMSLLLPAWHRDVKTLHHAWQLRTARTTPPDTTPHTPISPLPQPITSKSPSSMSPKMSRAFSSHCFASVPPSAQTFDCGRTLETPLPTNLPDAPRARARNEIIAVCATFSSLNR